MFLKRIHNKRRSMLLCPSLQEQHLHCISSAVIRKFHPRKFHPRKFHPAKIPPSENSTQRKLGQVRLGQVYTTLQSIVGWNFTWVEFSLGVIFVGGIFVGGIFVGGIFVGGIFVGGIFLEPLRQCVHLVEEKSFHSSLCISIILRLCNFHLHHLIFCDRL